MCGDKSTTFYLCFYLLIRRLCSVGAMYCGTCVATSQPRFICVFTFLIRRHGDKSTTFYLCGTCVFFLLIRRYVQVNHVLFVFYLLIRRYVVWDMCGDKSTTFYLCFYLLIRRLCSVGHVRQQVNHVLFAFLSFHGSH